MTQLRSQTRRGAWRGGSRECATRFSRRGRDDGPNRRCACARLARESDHERDRWQASPPSSVPISSAEARRRTRGESRAVRRASHPPSRARRARRSTNEHTETRASDTTPAISTSPSSERSKATRSPIASSDPGIVTTFGRRRVARSYAPSMTRATCATAHETPFALKPRCTSIATASTCATGARPTRPAGEQPSARTAGRHRAVGDGYGGIRSHVRRPGSRSAVTRTRAWPIRRAAQPVEAGSSPGEASAETIGGATWSARDVELAAEQLGPLLHPRKPEPAGLDRLGRVGNPRPSSSITSVIRVGRSVEPDRHVVRVGVPRDVGKRRARDRLKGDPL